MMKEVRSKGQNLWAFVTCLSLVVLNLFELSSLA
jgi:hypothetical protein